MLSHRDSVTDDSAAFLGRTIRRSASVSSWVAAAAASATDRPTFAGPAWETSALMILRAAFAFLKNGFNAWATSPGV